MSRRCPVTLAGQTSTYLNIQRGALRDSTRRIDKSACVAILLQSNGNRHPPDRKENEQNADNVTVN
jgi:hypothetical protein